METIIIYQTKNQIGYANNVLWRKLDEELKNKMTRILRIGYKTEDLDMLEYCTQEELIKILYNTLEQSRNVIYSN